MGVTIVDIAKAVGVSHPVVSKVLHGGKSNVGVSAELRSRIQQVAAELGYRPHAASQALRSQRFQAIGVLMGSEGESVYLPQATLSTLTAALASQEHICSLVCSSLDPSHLPTNPLLRAKRLDAMIVSYAAEVSQHLRDELARLDVPIVWMHHIEPADSVGLDEQNAAEQLVEHLADVGFQRFLFVDYSTGLASPATQHRLRGIEAASQRRSLNASMMVTQHVPRAQRFEVTRHWLERRNRPRAVIANSMHTAEAILQTALHLGLKVPQDLAIAAFDDGTSHNVAIPPMTVVVAPHAELGRAAGEMALQKAMNPQQPQANQLLKFQFIQGGTTPAIASSTSGRRSRSKSGSLTAISMESYS